MFRVAFMTLNSHLVLVLRNLWVRWVRTILTTLGIIVGVAAMVAVNATNGSTLSAISRFFDEAAGQSDLVVESSVSGESFDESVLNIVRRFPGVTVATPGTIGVTVPADEAADWQQQFGAGGTITPGSSFWLMGRDLEVDVLAHKYRLVDGRLLERGETAYSVLLVEDYAKDKEIKVGDDLSILTPSSGIVKLRVVGLIAKEDIGITNEGVIGITPLNVVQELFALSGQVNNIEMVVDDDIANDPQKLESLRQQIQDRLGDNYSVKHPASRGDVVAQSLQSYQVGLNFFSIVSLFVGSFLIYNAFAMTVVERTREIGMQRAIGMTRFQVFQAVILEALLLGVFGSAVGAGAGLLLARFLVVSVSQFSGQKIDQITAVPAQLIQAFIIGVIVTLLAALMPAYQASHVSPLQALRVQGNMDESRWLWTGLKFGPLIVFAALLILYRVPFRPSVAFFVGSASIFALLIGATLCIPIFTGVMERVIRPVIWFVFGNEGRLGSSNVERAKGRTTLTVAALMVGISMVVGINGMTTSFETDIQDWMDTAIGGDLFVRSPVHMQLDIEPRLLSLPEITAVTRSRVVSSRIKTARGDDEFALFVAIDPDTYLQVRSLRIQEGPDMPEIMRQLAAGDAIVVGADVANKLNLRLNEIVTLETKRGQRPFRIVAIVTDFSGGETITVTGSWGDLRRYFGVNDVNSYSVKLAPGFQIADVSDKIKLDIGRGRNLTIESKKDFEEKVRQLSSQAFSLFDVLGLIGLVVAALGVINTMLMNVLERTREIGGLRSLGMTQVQVQRLILAEAATIGFIGAVFGVGFGAVLSDVFIIGLRSIGGFVLNSQVPYNAMVYSFIIAFVVAICAAIYPAYRASRINIITAIKHE